MLNLRRYLQKLVLRVRRQRLCLRSFRKGFELRLQAPPRRCGGVLAFCVVRNGICRLPEFLDHYRALGVSEFFFVDNGSDDGTSAFLKNQPDVALWYTEASYRKSRFGVDWLNALKRRYGRDRWCLTVDTDELLVYPECETRPLPALAGWLDDRNVRSFSTLLLDMYSGPKGSDDDATTSLERAPFFDTGNYRAQLDPVYGHNWIQGGPRERAFFPHSPHRSPALNKIPFVRWARGYAYVSSTHHLLPRGLNKQRKQMPTGVLLHPKFLPEFRMSAAKETKRQEHYDRGSEYLAYTAQTVDENGLFHAGSCRFKSWRQLEAIGLMARGIWA